METVNSRAVRVRVLISLVLGITYGWLHSAHAQDNSWTNSAGGHWQDPYWSLGVLPGTNQNVLFTNAGSKTLTIDSSTAQNFPETLGASSIAVSAPAGSFNTLVLSNAVFATEVYQLTIGTNSAGRVYSSSFEYNFISVGGVFSASDSYIYGGTFYVGDMAPGVFNMTNSILVTSKIEMEAVGHSFPATFNQQGGTNVVGYLSVGSYGEYNLFDGTIEDPNGVPVPIVFDGYGATFNQFGGNLSARLILHNGLDTYHLAGGTLTSGNSTIPEPSGLFSVGEMLQSGGTNFAQGITLGSDGGPGFYELSGGVLVATNLIVRDHFLGYNPGESAFISVFSQSGGFHTNNSVQIYGASPNYDITPSIYDLSGGMLATPSIYLNIGAMTQSGGTNQVGNLLLNNLSTYSLSNGWLWAENITVKDFGVPFPFGNPLGPLATFQQSGGTNQVDGSLVVEGSRFKLTGGTLIAQNISINPKGVFYHQGGTVLPGVLAFGGGTWNEGTSAVQLGQLQLTTNSSFLSLPVNSCVLQFSNSSSLNWDSDSGLNIQNWSGSLYGGGQHQILFGTNATALTPQQLTQIQFQNPAGLAPGNYPARILATGEIVPDTGAPLPPMLNLNFTSNGPMHLSIGGDIGQTYSIEISTDLVHWNTWTNQFNTSGTMTLDDNDSTNFPQRFYRAHAMP